MPPAKIMIVEDEFIVAADLTASLEELGYDVVGHVTSGDEAEGAAGRYQPDLVIMDVVLPGGLDGVDAAKQIRDAYKIPVLFVTSHSDEELLERAKLAEPSGYLLKPFQDRELRAAIEVAMYKSQMEAQLRYSDEVFHQITENVREVLMLLDVATGVIVHANSGYEQIFSQSRKLLYENPLAFLERVDPDDREITAGVFTNRFMKGRPASVDYRIIAGDGEEHRWISTQGLPIADANGRAYRMVIVSEDVTERKKSEEKERALQARLRAIYEGFPVATFIWQHNKGEFLLLDYNRAGENLTGGQVRGLIGKRASSLFRETPEVIDKLERCFSEKSITRLEMLQQMFEERERRLLIVTYSYVDPDLVLTHVEDATERMKAERDLKASEERFRTIADFTYDWEYWRGPDGEFTWVSPSCERITGYTPEEFYANPDLFFDICHPQDRPIVEDFLKTEAAADKFYHLDFRILRQDGQIRWISHNGQPVYGADASWQGRRASNRDITGRKEVEDRLLAYQRQLRSLASELSLTEERERRSIAVDLHDTVGHTLAMCQIKLNQLQKKTKDENTAAGLGDVEVLIEEAITDTRTLTMEISPPALYELGLEAALDELAQQIQDEHGIDTEFLDDGLSKPLGNDARVALYRAVRELVINVVKHAKAEKLVVAVRTHGDRIIIEVNDDGVGFNMKKIQAESAKTRSFGLFSIRERIRYMGGEIRVDSSPGHGANVLVTAPLEPEK